MLTAFLAVVSLASSAVQEAGPGELRDAATEELHFSTHDGFPLRGKLTLPPGPGPHPIVVYVQSAEGMTVDMRRPLGGGATFDYFDLYAEHLPALGVGFFRYEGRGLTTGGEPPRFEVIDRAIYNTSTLDNKVRDVLSALELLGEQERVDAERVFLMGASEGTLIGADAAARSPQRIAGLVLYGVM